MTFDEAICAYTEKFGGFPAFLFMGASDDVIIDAVKKAISTGKEIEAESDNDY